MIKISVDRVRIRENHEQGLDLPVLAVEFDGSTQCIWARRVNILGPSSLVYYPDLHDSDDVLSSAWIETDADVEVQ